MTVSRLCCTPLRHNVIASDSKNSFDMSKCFCVIEYCYQIYIFSWNLSHTLPISGVFVSMMFLFVYYFVLDLASTALVLLSLELNRHADSFVLLKRF